MNQPHTARNKSNDQEFSADADKALWDLLGEARPARQPSPYFTRRVLRRIEAVQNGRGRWRSTLADWFREAFPRPLTAMTVLILVAAGSWLAFYPASQPATVAAVPAPSDLAEFEVLTDLDNLIAYEENALWIDSSNTF